MNKLFVAALFALILVSGSQGCASTIAPIPETTSPRITSLAAESLPMSKDMVTVENLLRWPLEMSLEKKRVNMALQTVVDVARRRQ